MKRTLLAALILLCSLPLHAQQKHAFATQGDHFALAPQSEHPHVAGLAQPILNGPVADQTNSKQE